MSDTGKQNQAPQRKQSWEDGVASATPQRSKYHTTLRTDGFHNNTVLAENNVEFWVAIRVDAKDDLWRVMHYQLFDMDQQDGKFKATPVTEKDVSFIEAVAHLSRSEYIAQKQLMHRIVDMSEKYPASNFPELRTHYYDITHYKNAAYVEGIAFDEYNDPYRRVDGKIFADAVFKRSEIGNSILAVENPINPQSGPMIEAGILSDMFAASSGRLTTLDGILRAGQCLKVMDDFATDMAAFYMSVQAMLGQKPNLDLVEGLNVEERKALQVRAEERMEEEYEDIYMHLIEAAHEKLQEAQKLGVHIEPFSKTLAQAELYLHMLNASICLPELEKSLHSINNADMDKIIEIQRSMQRAEARFKNLGGTDELVDTLKSMVLNPDKEGIPPSIVGYLSRYFTTRGSVMAKVQARKARENDVVLMSTQVVPPLKDPRTPAVADPIAEQDNAPAAAAKPAARSKKQAPKA